jgi:hypothetical protein
MPNNNEKLSRSQKLILVLYKLSGASKKQVRFEDIAVEAHRLFRSDFQLRGYPDFPDTGDIVHKPLYSELKKAGYVLSGNKFFSLTAKGLEYAKKLLQVTGFDKGMKNINSLHTTDKLRMSEENEIERILKTQAFQLYTAGKNDEIIDTDFYEYLGVTVRTNKFDFLGRLTTVEDAIDAVKSKDNTIFKGLSSFHTFLTEKFKENINYVKNSKGGKR